jgi:hypothetical protein
VQLSVVVRLVIRFGTLPEQSPNPLLLVFTVTLGGQTEMTGGSSSVTVTFSKQVLELLYISVAFQVMAVFPIGITVPESKDPAPVKAPVAVKESPAAPGFSPQLSEASALKDVPLRVWLHRLLLVPRVMLDVGQLIVGT